MSEIRIPASDFDYVANVIKSVVSSGVPLSDLVVRVRHGEMELCDKSGSYGVVAMEPTVTENQ